MKTFLLSIIYLIIIDSNTKETLPGVEVTNLKTKETYYSDFNGRVELCDDDSCKYMISYVSYSDTIVTDIKEDITIEIK